MKKVRYALTLLVSLAVLTGCQKSDKEGRHGNAGGTNNYYQPMDGPIDPYFVDLDMASAFAERITEDVFLNYGSNASDREFDSYYAVPDKDDKAALYVFNYADGQGYCILSADLRFMPICAFSTEGSFLKTDSIPSMLGSWIGATIERIEYLRGLEDLGGEIGAGGVNGWVALSKPINRQDLPNPHVVSEIGGLPCYSPYPPTITIKWPLLRSAWGQNCYYNDSLPNKSCQNTCNQKVLTGCVATAMAQVVRYWEHQPSSYGNYNYTSMPYRAYSGNADMARLMRDCGTSVNMDYGCDKSGADGSFFQWLFNNSVVPSALVNDFGFTSGGTYKHYVISDRYIIKSDIDKGRPVILSGSTSQASFLFWHWGTNGHKWVCDGYRMESDFCRDNFWYYMNWGWDGYKNAWYFQSNWEPSTTLNFQYQQKLIHSIYP